MTHDNLLVRKASAGSGKTFELAYSFIRLVLGTRDPHTGAWTLRTPGGKRNNHSSILAVTFTNKATEEMKRRIVRELAILAGVELLKGEKSQYLDNLKRDFGTPELDMERVTELAATALRDLLFDFHHFNVSTIDAFFQTVLRSFAYEADLEGNYEVKLDSKEMTNRSVSDLMAEITGQRRSRGAVTDTLMGWVAAIMQKGINEGHSFNMMNDNSDIYKRICSFINDLTGETYVKLQNCNDPCPILTDMTQVSTLSAEMAAAMDRLAARINAAASALADHPDFPMLNSTVKSVNKVLEWQTKVTEPTKGQLERLDAMLAGDPTELVKKEGKDKNKHFPESAPEMVRQLGEIILLIKDWFTLHAINRDIYAMGLLTDVRQRAEQMKKDDNTILLSDTNSLLSRIIGRCSVPFIYERIGQRLRHFLLDEFQDTSQLQWQNLKPLLLEGVDDLNPSLIIGDVKQCIYRFRNSDPELLNSQVTSDAELQRHVKVDTSADNWRSSHAVVDFNNHLFSTLTYPDYPSIQSVYSSVKQTARNTKLPEGYVDVEVFSEGDFFTQAMERMLDHMQRQLTEGGYEQSDIVVLVHRNTQAADVINYMLEHGRQRPGMEHLQVLSDESLIISSSPTIQNVIRLIRATAPSPRAQLTERERRYTPVSPAQLDVMLDEFEKNKHTAADSYAVLADAAEHLVADLGANRPAATHRPVQEGGTALFNVVEELIGRLPEDVRRADAVYLSAFQDLVLDYCATETSDLHSFLRWWDNFGHKAAINSAPSVNAVRVMTIHKSKGLEFPCVHVPLLQQFDKKQTDFRWITVRPSLTRLLPGTSGPLPLAMPLAMTSALNLTDFKQDLQDFKEMETLDAVNVLYVALTRPICELVVSIKPDKSSYLAPVIKALGSDHVISGSPSHRPDDEKKKADAPASGPAPAYDTYDYPGVWATLIVDPHPDRMHQA